MILYHGSDVEVKNPTIIKTEKGRDFGFGFYLTPIKEQAERMAKRKKKINKSKTAIVSIFEWDEKIDEVIYKKYLEPNLEWLEMIIKCRSDMSYRHDYDIVSGKIADDSVGETVLFVIEGILRKEDAIEKLKFQKINSQVAFCTEKALNHLTFKNSYEVVK